MYKAVNWKIKHVLAPLWMRYLSWAFRIVECLLYVITSILLRTTSLELLHKHQEYFERTLCLMILHIYKNHLNLSFKIFVNLGTRCIQPSVQWLCDLCVRSFVFIAVCTIDQSFGLPSHPYAQVRFLGKFNPSACNGM